MGGFPDRNKPSAEYPRIDTNNEFLTFKQLEEQIRNDPISSKEQLRNDTTSSNIQAFQDRFPSDGVSSGVLDLGFIKNRIFIFRQASAYGVFFQVLMGHQVRLAAKGGFSSHEMQADGLTCTTTLVET